MISRGWHNPSGKAGEIRDHLDGESSEGEDQAFCPVLGSLKDEARVERALSMESENVRACG